MFKKDTINKLNELELALKELSKLIETNELERLRKDSQELKQIKELLPNIHFEIDNIKTFNNENGKYVQVHYKMPIITLKMDSNGNMDYNPFFYATNFFYMISIEDMQKIQNAIEKLKNV